MATGGIEAVAAANDLGGAEAVATAANNVGWGEQQVLLERAMNICIQNGVDLVQSVFGAGYFLGAALYQFACLIAGALMLVFSDLICCFY